VLPRVSWPQQAVATEIKKDLAALLTQLGSRVSKVHSHVTEALVRHVRRQRRHDLQTM
jgi:hypothetical protein